MNKVRMGDDRDNSPIMVLGHAHAGSAIGVGQVGTPLQCWYGKPTLIIILYRLHLLVSDSQYRMERSIVLYTNFTII